MGLGNRLQALIVEDSAVFRELLKASLQLRCPSLEVLEAADKSEGLRLARSARPAWVFIDIQLPDGSGLALLSALRPLMPRSVLVVCTSYDTPEYREVASQFGADYFLAKDEMGAGAAWQELEQALSRASQRSCAELPA